MEPNLSTAKDPANYITSPRDEDDPEEEKKEPNSTPGMTSHSATDAYPRWKQPKKRKIKVVPGSL